MLVWVIYDISDDKTRKEISDTCKEFGLIRVQYSVFFGNLPNSCIDEIAVYSKNMIDKQTDGVFILPVSEDDFKKKMIIGKTFDEAFAKGEKQTMLL
ncbi:MAG: CRISPR-associated endonuclease Cas2 [Victivallales bacterium]|nr:CRISPR-associated endonuclease Cas2 [Victivallales bacterium]MCF7888743.1 CRISPR-associated endonuclease Cas2 [Victivallales bacterium]